MRNQSTPHSLLWYDNESIYLRFKRSAEDPVHFSRPYEVWASETQASLQYLERAGKIQTCRIHVVFGEFAEWCKVQGYKQDSAARIGFASFKAAQIYG